MNWPKFLTGCQAEGINPSLSVLPDKLAYLLEFRPHDHLSVFLSVKVHLANISILYPSVDIQICVPILKPSNSINPWLRYFPVWNPVPQWDMNFHIFNGSVIYAVFIY